VSFQPSGSTRSPLRNGARPVAQVHSYPEMLVGGSESVYAWICSWTISDHYITWSLKEYDSEWSCDRPPPTKSDRLDGVDRHSLMGE
jgi:hypothetical protein